MHRNRIADRKKSAPATPCSPYAEPLEPRLLLAAQLLKEINPTASTQFANFLSINNTTYFTVDDDAHGTELWRTDGTPAGTTLVKDTEPGPASSSPTFLTNVNGTLFFTARTSAYGAELWKSDGTDAGTVMVADITPGPLSGRAGIGGMIALGNSVLFSAAAGPNDGVELWASDGTAAGTHLVKDIAGPNAGSGPADFLRAGTWVYFAASTSTGGRELWRTDGTDAGTTLVKDIRPGSSSSNPRLLGAIGDRVVFTADNGSTGDELWGTDGTAAGTTLLRDIRPGFPGAGIDYWAVAGNQLFFNAYDGTSLGDELYATDGTPAGTRLVKDISPNGGSGAPRYFVPFGNVVYFSASTTQYTRGLWVSDGTDLGTRLVQDFPTSIGAETRPVGVSRGALYVSAGDGSGAANLWKLTPTAGLSLVRADVGVTLAVPNVPGGFVFAADDFSGQQLYVSNGTPAGTRPLLRPRPFGPGDAAPRDFTPFGNRYLFSANDGAHGAELWATDGTPAGTSLIKDINPGTPDGLTGLPGAALNGFFYFDGNDGSTGQELWRTDGTPQGTTLFKDLRPGPARSSPTNFATYNGAVYFTILLSNNTQELWRTDGTPAGTVRLADYYANVPGGYINVLRVIGNNLYVRTESAGEADLYRFNGSAFLNLTAALPYVYDFNDAGNGQVYVNAGSRLYSLNAKTAAATPLTDASVSVNTGWGSLGTSYYFSAYGATGNEFYVTDGTAAGTHLVQDLYPGSTSSTPANPFFHAGHLYFTALSDTGWALWSIDAPGAAPAKLLDLAPAAQLSVSIAYADLGGDLYFTTSGSTPAAGKLWKINAAGQPEVVDAAFPYPQAGLLNVNGALLFTVSDATHGSELYRYPALADTTPPTVTESAFLPWSASQTVSITFDEDLAALPAPAALQLLNLTTGQAFAPSAVTWNPYTRTLVFATAAPLPAGDYRATLAAGSVTDLAGNALAAPHVLTFTLLRGDVNGDRTINFDDLLILAKNYNNPDALLIDGDLNGDGLVNFDDLLILAKNYNTTLPTPPPPPPAPALAALAPTKASKSTKPTPFSSKPVTVERKPAPTRSRRPTR